MAGHYDFKLETISCEQVPMLDVLIFKPPLFACTGRFGISPYIKPTSNHIPLHFNSAHPARTHRSWPLSEIARMNRNSCNRSIYERFKEIKLSRFAWFFMPPQIIESCRKWKPRMPIGKSPLFSSDNGLISEAATSSRVCRLVLPWHPNAIRGLFPKLRNSWDMRKPMLQRVGLNADIQLAYSSSGKPLESVMKSLKL